jgi:hypothetical protein
MKGGLPEEKDCSMIDATYYLVSTIYFRGSLGIKSLLN